MRYCTFILLTLVATFLLGCVTDISHDPRYRTDYAVDGAYRVKKPLFLDRGQRSIFGVWDHGILIQPGFRMAGIPSSVAQYEREREQEWKNIAGIVAPGTWIRVTKIKLDRNPEMGKSISVECVILEGEFAGMKSVELSFVSRKRRDQERLVDVPMVSDEVLERLVEP